MRRELIASGKEPRFGVENWPWYDFEPGVSVFRARLVAGYGLNVYELDCSANFDIAMSARLFAISGRPAYLVEGRELQARGFIGEPLIAEAVARSIPGGVTIVLSRHFAKQADHEWAGIGRKPMNWYLP